MNKYEEFSDTDMEKYFTMEYYHSLDIVLDIPMNLDDYNPSFKYDLFSVFSKFHECVRMSRYSVPPYWRNPETQLINLVENCDSIMQKIFSTLDLKNNIFTSSIEVIENYIIFIIYSAIHDCLEQISNKLNLESVAYKWISFITTLDSICNRIDVPNIGTIDGRYILKSFIQNSAKLSEKNNKECIKRFLRYRYERFKSKDRLGYWTQNGDILKGGYPTYLEIDMLNIHLRRLLIQNKTMPHTTITNNWMKLFIILLSTKYHIMLHKNEMDSDLADYIKNFEIKKNEIVRIQKIFTFCKIITKYFSQILSDDPDKERDYSGIFQITAYLRRGHTYQLLKESEMAFNDFSYGEKLSNMLSNSPPVSSGKIYSYITKPYSFILKGELYRKDYAYNNAVQYFCASMKMFGNLKHEPLFLEKSIRLIQTKMSVSHLSN